MIDTLSLYTKERRSKCLLGMKLLIISIFCQKPVFLTYLVQGGRVLLEQVDGSQLVKKIYAFYGTRRFITAFTGARHLSLSWASSIQFTPHLTS